MRTILTNNSIAGISPHHVSLLTSCDSCSVGKARKASAPKASRNKATTFGARLMSDNSGVLRVQSKSGKTMANVTLDEATSWIWVTPLSSTKHTFLVIKNLLEVELHQKHEHRVLYFRSDGGSDMCCEKWIVS